MNKFKKYVALASLATIGAVQSASAQLVAYDSATDAVSFDPAPLISPVIDGVVAGVLAGVALFVIFMGIRYVKRALKTGGN